MECNSRNSKPDAFSSPDASEGMASVVVVVVDAVEESVVAVANAAEAAAAWQNTMGPLMRRRIAALSSLLLLQLKVEGSKSVEIMRGCTDRMKSTHYIHNHKFLSHDLQSERPSERTNESGRIESCGASV